jgi:hypothetical protein
MIFDWHYEGTEPTAAYFALKGFDVATSSSRNGAVAKVQLALLEKIRKNSNEENKLDDATCFKMLFCE